MTSSGLEDAMKALSQREQITAADWKSRIGNWKIGDPAPKSIPSLPEWSGAHGLDAAVWTALEPQYTKKGESKATKERPPIEWVVDYLLELTGPNRDVAEKYFRCAPPQIDTEYRRRVEAALGWGYREC